VTAENPPGDTNGAQAESSSTPSPSPSPCPSSSPRSTRRGFLRGSLGAAGGLAALAAALSPLRDLDTEEYTLEKLLQKHYKEMEPGEMREVLERVRKEIEKRHRVTAEVRDIKPQDNVRFAYALHLGLCIGCRRCVYACVEENNPSRAPEIQYIRVLELPRGSIDLERADHHYEREKVPEDHHYYMPVQCHQCANPPCVKVCPVEATWQEPDGITVIDYDWCIGCRYCEAACPYWARRFNFAEPRYARDESGRTVLNEKMAYLSNRPRHKGVMEKCHFCLQRTREGRMPACVEVCPVGARKFGNLLDPDSEVAQILETKHIFVLKQDVGTLPRFFYYFDEDYPRSEKKLPAEGNVDSSAGGGG
jgi:molybdopterin-containing oxidoreductase family iron-sulfur binding subunit